MLADQLDFGEITPLLNILRLATREERIELADLADTTVPYLYQLAGRQRKRSSVQMAVQIEDASRVMHRRSNGRIPEITCCDIAKMLDGHQ